jgi:tartrate dehydrogenase/decarboxylase/D-malate dehydrogenase
MLDFLGCRAGHDLVLGSIERLLADPHAPRTRDLGGTAGTADMGRALAEEVARSPLADGG